MSDIRAVNKHPCPECGGDAEWNAKRKALVCPYCGTDVPWNEREEAYGTEIKEYDLDDGLAFTHQAKGISRESRSVKCESCHAISIFDKDRAAQRCDFCGSPAIIPTTEEESVITPESLLPAVIPSTQVRTELRKWYSSRWFAPNKLKRLALTDTVRGVYLPYWTFDAHADADWQAEAGYHYYVTESYTDSDGKTQTREVQHTRWEWASGSISHFFDDDLVPATVGLHLSLLREVEPFPTNKDLKPYDPAYVRGWTVERYQVDLEKAAQTNVQQMEQHLYTLCSKEVPGDTQRNLSVDATFVDRTFKHILVPVWLISYNYGAKCYQVVVNGYTGKIAGERPYSWVKITFAILFALIMIAVITLFVAGLE